MILEIEVVKTDTGWRAGTSSAEGFCGDSCVSGIDAISNLMLVLKHYQHSLWLELSKR